MNHERAIELAERLLESWNTQEVERVVDCYTDDVRYRDPNTRGFVEGSDALRRYLTKLFDRWQMHWALREAYPFQMPRAPPYSGAPRFARAAATARWRSTAWTWPWSREIDLSRNDVYFDRAALASLVSATVWLRRAVIRVWYRPQFKPRDPVEIGWVARV